MRNLFFCIIALSTLGTNAQTKVNGELEATGGYGHATPWASTIKLDITTPKFTFKPYFGVTGITRESSATQDDISLTYSRTHNHYTSSMERETKGYEMNYGALLQYAIDKRTTLSAAINGTHRNTDTRGSRTESFVAPSGALLSSVRSRMLTPTLRTDDLSVEAGLQHRTNKQGEVINVIYEYKLTHDKQEDLQEVTDQTNFTAYTTNFVQTHANIQEHNVQADWHRPVAKGHVIGSGLLYGRNDINSTDLQELDNVATVDETFHHLTQKAGAFVDYNMNLKSVSLTARAEYNYTRMEKRNLHDVIPFLRMQWRMNQRNTLQVLYAQKIIRPVLEQLNPARIRDAYTLRYGNADLTGLHANNASLAYIFKNKGINFTTTLTHIFADDGYNAIWIEAPDDTRIYTLGNEGVRRAWSLTPDLEWKVCPKTIINAKATVMWDKRIARAINLEHEHWGVSTQLRLQQELPLGLKLGVFCNYSEGNTLDLYSYASRAITCGGDLKRSFLKDNRLTATLAYSYSEYPHIVVEKGFYAGSIFSRPKHHHAPSLSLSYRF